MRISIFSTIFKHPKEIVKVNKERADNKLI